MLHCKHNYFAMRHQMASSKEIGMSESKVKFAALVRWRTGKTIEKLGIADIRSWPAAEIFPWEEVLKSKQFTLISIGKTTSPTYLLVRTRQWMKAQKRADVEIQEILKEQERLNMFKCESVTRRTMRDEAAGSMNSNSGSVDMIATAD